MRGNEPKKAGFRWDPNGKILIPMRGNEIRSITLAP